MLTRLRFRQDFRLIARCLSDKPSDSDGKAPDNKAKSAEMEKVDSSTEKIQALLKSMMTDPKMKENEYQQKFATAPDIPRKRKQNLEEDVVVKTEKIEESITKAAAEVAQVIGGDVKQTEAELLSKVLGKINQTSTSLSDLIIGMKVDRTKEGADVRKRESRGEQVKRFVDQPRAQHAREGTRYTQRKGPPMEWRENTQRSQALPKIVDIFDSEPLGIFKSKPADCGTQLAVWEALQARELDLATSQPPENYFQKMIQWTDQGKVWRFPIDNEQGMEEEQSVHFSEHIFLDQHLEGWCPKGPIRHFMELVCVGLSKNPFYTVQEKKDHIMWYKEYFEAKKEVLTEVGAWKAKPAPEVSA